MKQDIPQQTIKQPTNNEKPAPHNYPAEEAVIGSIFVDPACLSEVATIVRPHDFFDPSLRAIFQAMLMLNAKEAGIDEISVGTELASMNKLEDVGGRARLMGITGGCVTSVNADYHALCVKRCSIQRQLISTVIDIAGKAYVAGDNIDAVLREAQDALLAISSKQEIASVLTPAMVANIASDLYQHRRDGVDHEVMPFGLLDLDRQTGGAHKSDFIILAGHTGVGKSAMAQGWTRNIGKEHNVLYFSTEMSMPQLIDREMAVMLDCSTSILTSGNYFDKLFDDIIQKCAGFSDRHVYYFNSAAVTTADIHWAATKAKQQYGLDMVVVDYIQQLADDYGRSLNERIGYITRKLKNMATSLNISVVGLSQLNRESEKMDDKRPKRWQLRDSGSLEQDADVIMFLYRDDYYYTKEAWDAKFPPSRFPDKPYPQNIVEVLIEKQRQREAPVMHRLYWEGKTMQHKNLMQVQS